MQKFEVGQRVKRVRGGSSGNTNEGDVGVVKSVHGMGYGFLRLDSGVVTEEVWAGNYALVENNNKITNLMQNLVQKYRLLTASEPEKSFIQAGVMNDKFELTADGKSLFETFMFEKYKNDFKTEVVEKILAEEK